MALLPLPLNRLLGACLGWIIWKLDGKQRRVTQINLTLCFPYMSRADRARLVRASLMETGKLIAETAWIRKRSARQLAQLIDQTHFDEQVLKARQSGQPIIYAAPHLGNWELGVFALARNEPLTYFYSEPKQRGRVRTTVVGRADLGGTPVTMDVTGIRQALKSMQQGHSLAILPDQEPERANGVFAPFFGITANTQTLLPGLVQRTGALVTFGFMERLGWRQGWRFHYVPADPGVYDPDRQKAAAAVNRSIETCVNICPEQYLWSYMRFQLLPAGRVRIY